MQKDVEASKKLINLLEKIKKENRGTKEWMI